MNELLQFLQPKFRKLPYMHCCERNMVFRGCTLPLFQPCIYNAYLPGSYFMFNSLYNHAVLLYMLFSR